MLMLVLLLVVVVLLVLLLVVLLSMVLLVVSCDGNGLLDGFAAGVCCADSVLAGCAAGAS